VGKIAAIYGHLEMVKWVCQQNSNLISTVCYSAIECSQLRIVEWAHNQTAQSLNICDITHAAARSGQVDILKWAYLVSNHEVDLEKCASLAAQYGMLEVLQWIDGLGYKLDKSIYLWATRYGYTYIDSNAEPLFEFESGDML
jgi:hypothetical protein